VFTIKHNKLAVKGTDLRENQRNRIQQQIIFLQRQVSYTWNFARIEQILLIVAKSLPKHTQGQKSLKQTAVV